MRLTKQALLDVVFGRDPKWDALTRHIEEERRAHAAARPLFDELLARKWNDDLAGIPPDKRTLTLNEQHPALPYIELINARCLKPGALYFLGYRIQIARIESIGIVKLG